MEQHQRENNGGRDGSILGSPNLVDAPSQGIDRSGEFAGGQIGYNWQQNRLVFGVEADFQGAAIGGQARAAALVPGSINVVPDGITAVSAQSNLDWFGTVRGRAGFTFDHMLIYATGGFAFGGTKDQASSSILFGGDATPTLSTAKAEETRTGFVIGGGLEYALTPAWSLKGEFQHIDLGSTKLDTEPRSLNLLMATRSGSGSAEIDHVYNTVRVGLNYHIGGESYEPLNGGYKDGPSYAAYSWSGLYGGVNGGFDWNNTAGKVAAVATGRLGLDPDFSR